MKQKLSGIKELHRELATMVRDRDLELRDLTDELLEKAERRRMALGQELHDGIGQHLTGVQLLCSSIEHQLKTESCEDVQMAAILSSKSAKIHNAVRTIARTLFPIRIAHVGLYSALNEMISCYEELHGKTMRVIELSEMHKLTETLALQFYRICQESCTFLMEHAQAEIIEISLQTNSDEYIVAIEHDGYFNDNEAAHTIFNLIRYRLKKIDGKMHHSRTTLSGRSVIYFKAPKPTH